ncbi:PREDICTED: uncharacterized protein LOC106119141 [Papilio xuthus]|uniref:Uncharacterized protein LOC106119141 n=1 Tax=Papilio xuthus TaxID=66420 RepID=A0AAJ7EAL1_PAPXU|nr:PREDICTED: uncharacterized protein LOC106119141 [Papilio xuthus]
MNKPVILSGYDLVAKGITKNQATLPELGLKDIFPNGSWLEAKQIQSAIDARKQLIAAERIEKSGMLSHAEWRENLMLAAVIQKSGGHWQFMGHNVGKQLYLYPEEALFLMEINSLLLKHNDVKVSLQQAYDLLLRDKTSFIQYKVYATLSRWGYKVFRHMDTNALDICYTDETNITSEGNNSENSLMKIVDDELKIVETDKQSDVILLSNDDEERCNLKRKSSVVDDPDDLQINEMGETPNCKKPKSKDQSFIYLYKIDKLKNRQLKPCNTNELHKYFENIPNLLNSEVVTLNVPNERFIPKNISFNKSTYVLNLNSVRTKQLRVPSPQESQTSNSTDDINRANFTRIRGNYNRYQIPPYIHYSPMNDPRNIPYRPFNWWHSYARVNNYNFNMSFQRPLLGNNFNMSFQRPLLGNLLFPPRFQYFPRYQNFYRPRNNFNRPYNRRQRKRSRDSTKKFHLESLKRLAARLKNLVTSGQVHTEPLAAINNLIQTYNSRYASKIKLSNDYEIIEDHNILDTIELDDDGEQIKKKPRLSDSDTYTINFNNIIEMAERLKKLENDNKSSARHRRAFSNLIKTFNKSYNADIYVTNNFKVLDRSFISLESSSDSDCVIDENANSSGKKVRNPFNILKRLSEKRNKSLDAPSTSSDFNNEKYESDDYRDIIQKNLSKEWIPDDNDFGRPEIYGINNESNIANLFYEFLKFHPENYENWLDLKVSFLSSLEETADFFRKKTNTVSVQNRSLVSPEDCVDIVSVLKKLSIIKSHNETGETNIKIDFNVYNRDVQHFRKTNPPVPHFRISCLDESEKFPSGEEIASLHAKYNDDVRIIFAIVGTGTINFVQIKPISLPTHISNNVT